MFISQPVEVIVFAIFIGFLLVVGALLPGGKFYHSGAPGTKHGPPIEPAWIGRLVILMAGLATILDGIWEIRHR